MLFCIQNIIRKDSIDSFCDSFIERFEYIAKKRKINFTQIIKKFKINNRRHDEKLVCKKQQIKINIIKKQTKIKIHAKIFACKRCSIKYSNNIQFHKYIDEHHIKNSKIEFVEKYDDMKILKIIK